MTIDTSQTQLNYGQFSVDIFDFILQIGELNSKDN